MAFVLVCQCLSSSVSCARSSLGNPELYSKEITDREPKLYIHHKSFVKCFGRWHSHDSLFCISKSIILCLAQFWNLYSTPFLSLLTVTKHEHLRNAVLNRVRQETPACTHTKHTKTKNAWTSYKLHLCADITVRREIIGVYQSFWEGLAKHLDLQGWNHESHARDILQLVRKSLIDERNAGYS